MCEVKLRHFSERVEARRQYFYFLYLFLIGWKQHWTILLDTDFDPFDPVPFTWNWIRLTP